MLIPPNRTRLIPRYALVLGLGCAALLLILCETTAWSTSRQHPHSPDDCTAVFGDQRSRLRNGKGRAMYLYWVDEADTQHDPTIVAHGNVRWRAPKPLRVEGITVLRGSDDSEPQQAVVNLAPSVARQADCPAGRYLLAVDDNVGPASILAVVEEGVLVAYRRKLGFIPAEDEQAPQWLMAWGSRWKMAPPRTGSSKPHRPKPRPKRHKKRGRRR